MLCVLKPCELSVWSLYGETFGQEWKKAFLQKDNDQMPYEEEMQANADRDSFHMMILTFILTDWDGSILFNINLI